MWVGLRQFPQESQLAHDTYNQIMDAETQLNKSLQSAENIAVTSQQREMATKAINDAKIYEGYFGQVQQNYANYQNAARIMFVDNTNASNQLTSDLHSMKSLADPLCAIME